ncbi:MAG: putative selenate reductase subunit YgfK [Woeseiaceae bacterium]|nr:putative selenate reductase subunit YgfK [Woeseiaceae bacterium]
MSALFQPIAADQLFAWVFRELETRDSVFGIPRRHFFKPRDDERFATTAFNRRIGTPFGPAAGPHTQMAQNIVAAWLCGARYIELKTVQTLDELDVSKPCIDMEDEGYNVEWSQELKVRESLEEYVRAWVLIHALHRTLGFPGVSPDVVFNLSVGYNLEGIRQPNMQWFLDETEDAGAHVDRLLESLESHYPDTHKLDVPHRLSDNVTLSTMHGCPPEEIESISAYLMQERGLHTLVKCNPTLLGADRVRGILNDDLGYVDVVVPDEAFGHDLKYEDAVPMLTNLRAVANTCGLEFGVKLSNTLEVENQRTVFDPAEKMMYLSGRPLHAITVNLASKLNDEFDGDLLMSFSAGANCFNAPDLLAGGMQTVTSCSDLLKTGGYLRMLQYVECLDDALENAGVKTLAEFRNAFAETLDDYARRVVQDPMYSKSTFDTAHTKTPRRLEYFDCIEAPCVDECPISQQVPQYMRAVHRDNDAEAISVVRKDNPLPCVLGRVCDHLCELTCVRNHIDEPVAIRDVKRYIADLAAATPQRSSEATGIKVAVIGAGPGGLAAAKELAAAGCHVEVFEQHERAGGMVGGAVPEYRLPWSVFEKDLQPLEALGVVFHYGKSAGKDFTLADLRNDGFDRILILVGAQRSKMLGLEGEDSRGVIDALAFLRQARNEQTVDIGKRVGVIGAGDTAMDCARVAKRLSNGDVTLVYRRTVDQMPADREEIKHLLEEGIDVVELCKPQALTVDDGKLRALVSRRMEYRGDRDASGRKVPHEIPGSDFEIPLDTLILAISQSAILDFLGDERIALNERGYIVADPVTFETSLPGVYAGGDVANEGPASIVKAAAAGKAIAAHILGRQVATAAPDRPDVDVAGLLRRKSHRQWRTPSPELALERRQGFEEVVLTFDEEQARAEAGRCLDCDVFCGLCVSVCPNLALQTYELGPEATQPHQRYQVAVIADLCNECGNCTTFCPTAGRPYRDKPRLYVDRGEFESQDENAFMVFSSEDGWSMDARVRGETRHISLGDPHEDAEPFTTMHTLLAGIAASIPELPSAGGPTS